MTLHHQEALLLPELGKAKRIRTGLAEEVFPLNLNVPVLAKRRAEFPMPLTCSTDPRLYDVVDEAGEYIARQVPDLNTARVLAAAPRLLDGFYEMRWRLNCWFIHGYGGVGISDRRDELEAQTEEWLERMGDIEEDACALDGRFPR